MAAKSCECLGIILSKLKIKLRSWGLLACLCSSNKLSIYKLLSLLFLCNFFACNSERDEHNR